MANTFTHRGRPVDPDAAPTRVPAETDFAWAAGLFERNGEVKLSIDLDSTVTIKVGQQIDLATRLQDLFGGRIKDSPGNSPGRYDWKCRRPIVLTFLDGIMPFLSEATVARVRDVQQKEAAIAVVESRKVEAAVRAKEEAVVPKIEFNVTKDFEFSTVLNAVRQDGRTVFGFSDALTQQRFRELVEKSMEVRIERAIRNVIVVVLTGVPEHLAKMMDS